MDDAALVRQMRAGNEQAFDAFFDAYFDRVFRFALRQTGDADAAEDLAQATLVTAVRRLETWRGEAALLTWLCTICRREALAHWDRARRQPATARIVEDEADMRAILDSLARRDQEEAAARLRSHLGHTIDNLARIRPLLSR